MNGTEPHERDDEERADALAAHVEDGEWSALYETVGREFGKLFETGMTPAVALDWLMTETGAFTVAEWAAVRGVPRNAVDQSRARARTALDRRER